MHLNKQILFVICTILCSTGLFAQVHIGDGVTISKGTTVLITNQNVKISTKEIRGDGKLVIRHEDNLKVTVNADIKQNSNIDIQADNVEVSGSHATKFTALYLPQLSKEVKLAAQREQEINTEKNLPIRYINVEGLVFDTKNERKDKDPILKAMPISQKEGAVNSVVLEIHAIDLEKDYIIPIYSTLNDARFSDDAKLYEFESLTAILKPPIG